ncbi:MAG: DEAD/DEAH box helicase [Porticoccaceae bacterium]
MAATGPTIELKNPLPMVQPGLKFYQHQAEGIPWLIRRDSWLLADDMGLGKTIQTQVALAWMHNKGLIKRVLVICPPSLKDNWFEETEQKTKFVPVVVPATTPKRRTRIIEDFDNGGGDILIVNFEQVIAHFDQLMALRFDAVVVDECHLVKNRKSKRTKAVLALTNGIQHRCLLTGSPILNNVDDLWTLLHMIDPQGAPSYWTYRNRYVKLSSFKLDRMDPKTGKMRKVTINTVVGVKNEAELHQKLKLVMLRREKSECMDLPDKHEIVYRVSMSDEQRKVYDEALAGIINVPGEPDPMEVESAIVQFGILKAICGTTLAVSDQFGDHSGKLDRAVELAIEMFENGKSFVAFTQHRPVLAAWAARLAKAGFTDNSFQLHGHVKQGDRQAVVRDWTTLVESGTPSVLSCMYQIGGVGFNMTACSTVMQIDKLFVPKLNDQAIDRVHRIGVDLTRPVDVISFVTKDSIESRIEEINRNKRKVFGMVVDGMSEAEYKRRLVKAVMTT